MAATVQATKNTITLRGSAEIVTEFFGYSINSILFQRGIYDPETFVDVNKYGLRMWVTTDEGLKAYLQNVLAQLSDWLQAGLVRELVLVITDLDSSEVLERWVFQVQTDEQALATGLGGNKERKQVQREIAAIIRQITSSVSFLPLLESPCTFDLLVYTHRDAVVPDSWEASDPRYISNSSEVRLRSFTTTIHRVDTWVAYKVANDELQQQQQNHHDEEAASDGTSECSAERTESESKTSR